MAASFGWGAPARSTILSRLNILTFGSVSTERLQLNGNSAFVAGLNSASSNAVVENGNGSNANVVFGAVIGDTETYAGTLVNTVSTGTGTLGFLKGGAGTLNLTNAGSTYTGVTELDGGTLNVASLANIGSASSIGAGNSTSTATNASSLVFGGGTTQADGFTDGTLQYTGSTPQTTNRLFTLGDVGNTVLGTGGVAGNNGTIDASGAGTGSVTFSNTAAIAFANTGTHNLTLTGTNTGSNTFAPLVGDSTVGSGYATSLTKSGVGTWAVTNANTFSGGTTVTGGTLLASNTSGSATGAGATTVSAGATLGGYGASSGTSFSISGTGTTTATRANVLAGLNSTTDTSVTTTLTLKGSSAGTIADANLTFNLNSTVAGGLGTDPANSGTELAVGNTPITFGLGTQSTILSLNVSTGIIGAYTPYVLVAGLTTGGADQYTNLALGTPTGSLATGLITPILNSNLGGTGNVTLSLSGTAAGFYGRNSYLFLYQNSTSGADDIEVEVVPEPSTWALILGGFALLMVRLRRQRKSQVHI